MSQAPEMIRACANVLRPPEDISPSEFAAKYRYLNPVTTAVGGLWSNDVFPYLIAIMDAVQLALNLGKNLVMMKSGQGGGSEAIINALLWLRLRIAGPFLYMISKDDLAKEFSRERFDYAMKTCPPIQEIALCGRGSGATIHVKRFVNGKLVIIGGQSSLNIISTPYPVVIIDEFDSIPESPDGGDFLAKAENRMEAFAAFGPTILIAFAHPTTKDRGAGKLYYEKSDQRRGFISCPHCDGSFWLDYENDVKVIAEGSETMAIAEQNPKRYHHFVPCCGAELSDAQRWLQIRKGVRQEITIPAEQAARMTYVGVHFNSFYAPHRSLEWLAGQMIQGFDSPTVMKEKVNKVLGDVHTVSTQETTQDQWRACIVTPQSDDDPEAYYLGEVPPGVQFLTAGQDSGSRQLHWAVWGWGIERDEDNLPWWCGWLIDAGVVEHEHVESIEASHLRVFDQVLYQRLWPQGDSHIQLRYGYHDEGWCPVAIYEYCRGNRGRAYPCMGDAVDDKSTRAPHRWGRSPRWLVNGREITDKLIKRALLNTYLLKIDFFSLVGKTFHTKDRIRTRLTLPRDIERVPGFLKQSSAEYLTMDGKKQVWAHRGEEHFSDCNIYAYAASINARVFKRERTKKEEPKQQNQHHPGKAQGGGWQIGRD